MGGINLLQHRVEKETTDSYSASVQSGADERSLERGDQIRKVNGPTFRLIVLIGSVNFVQAVRGRQ